MRLKACVLQICQEFIQCQNFKKGIHEFVVKQMNRLTCIKQICKSISQSVEQISVQSFIPQRKTQEEFHKQIEALEIEILGSIPEHYQGNQSFEVKSCKDRWKNQIICSLTSLLIILLILVFWKQTQNPFECIRNDDSLYCKVNLEKEGTLFQDIQLDYQIKNLTIDFSENFIEADKIIFLLSKIQANYLQYFVIDLQNNDVSKEGLQNLFKYFSKYQKTYEVRLNLVNTTLDNQYFIRYQNNPKEAYIIIDDLVQDYELAKQKIVQFSINSNFSSYLKAISFISSADHLSNNIYLKNFELKDEEFYYLFEQLFKLRSQQVYIDINLVENQIDGSSLVKIMKNYINKQHNITNLSLKISYNPIKMEYYKEFIQLIQENNDLMFVDLELDLNLFILNENEFQNITFFKKNQNQKLETFNVKMVQAGLKALYQISKFLVSNNIRFGITALVNHFEDVNLFQIDFPLNEEYCQAQLPQAVQNSKLQIHEMEVQIQQRQILADKNNNFNFKICQDQNEIEKSLQTSLKIKLQKQVLQKSIKIFDDKENKSFYIDVDKQEYISELQDGTIINFIQPQHQNEYQFKQFIFEGYHISDLIAQNVVELIKNNKYLNEIIVQAEFNTLSQNSIKMLLSSLYTEQNIKQAHLNLHYSYLLNQSEYQEITQQHDILDLVAESITKSQNLLDLHVSYGSCDLAAFNPIIQAFKNSTQLKNLTIEFNNKNISELELRNFYYSARSFKDEGKNLKTINLLHSQTISDYKKIYFTQEFYQQILFEMRESGDELQIFDLDELSELMIQDFIDEIQNFKTKEIVLNAQNEIKNEKFALIFKKISQNSNVKKLFFQSKQLSSSKISSMMSNLSKSTSITYLQIRILQAIQEDQNQNKIEQSTLQLINEMKNLQIFSIDCNNCLESEKSFQKIVDQAYQSQNLQGINLIDKNLNISEQTIKRIALIQTLLEKEKFFNISQYSEYQLKFQEYINQFKNNDKSIFNLVYKNSDIDESLLIFLNRYIKKYSSSLTKINIQFNKNNLTDKHIQILSGTLQNLNDLQQININLQINQISDEGCNQLLNSFAPFQLHIKNFQLNLKENNFVEFSCLTNLLNLMENMNELKQIYLILPNLNENSFAKILNNLQNKQQLDSIFLDVDELIIQMKEAILIGSKFGKLQNLNSVTIKGQYERLIQSHFQLQKLQESNNAEFNLDFSNTFQYYESIKEIFQQISGFKVKLQKLSIDFSQNNIQDDSIYLIASYIENNIESITDLDINLSINPIYDEGCSELTKILQNSKILTNFTLNIKNTNITPNFFNSIIELKEKNKIIKQITLKLNDIDLKSQQKIEKILLDYEGIKLIFESN
ncbi:hypothetical protein ABPG74_018525 [Tetrahymena malaccensis]